MRYSIYALIICVVFTGIFIYLINTLSPWNQDAVNAIIERFNLLTGAQFREFVAEGLNNGNVFELLNLKNLIILLVVGLIAFTSGFSTIHLFVDKLFFRKFYENPSVFHAVRRGMLIGLVIIALSILRLVGSLDFLVFAGCAVFAILVEALVMAFAGRHHHKEEVETAEEKENKPEKVQK